MRPNALLMAGGANKILARVYATLDPASAYGGTASLSGDKLTCTLGQYCSYKATIAKTTGKHSWEVFLGSTTGSNFHQPGIATATDSTAASLGGTNDTGIGFVVINGSLRYFPGDLFTGAATAAPGDRLRFEMDCDNHTLQIFKANVSIHGPVTIPSVAYRPAASVVSAATCVMTFNFGATPFVDPPTAGFNTGVYQ